MSIESSVATSIISNENYGVCYEPIVDIKTLKIVAYEALSRFAYNNKTISPDEFFKSIHDNLEVFFFIETLLKKFQAQNRPRGKRLFLNVDPEIAINNNHVQFWINFCKTNENIVVEIIENSDEESAADVEQFMDWMDEFKISYAYDDFAKPNSMFFASLLTRASVIKLDMNFLKRIKEDEAYAEFAKGVINYAKLSSKETVLEGVENSLDLKIANDLGVDYIQGYYFKKDFITIWK